MTLTRVRPEACMSENQGRQVAGVIRCGRILTRIMAVAICLATGAIDADEKAPTRFTDNGDGTVTDHEQGVMWMQAPLQPEKDDPVPYFGTVTGFGWDLARSRARTVTFAGHRDWRLPTVDELHSLVDCGGGQQMPRHPRKAGGWCLGQYRRPTIDPQFFPETPQDLFWSSSKSDRHHAWGVDFTYGMAQSVVKGRYAQVRLVRTLKPEKK